MTFNVRHWNAGCFVSGAELLLNLQLIVVGCKEWYPRFEKYCYRSLLRLSSFSGSHRKFHFRLNKYKVTLQSSQTSVFRNSQLCRWSQCNSLLQHGPVSLSSYHFSGADRHYSTKPLRDVKPDNIQTDDVPGAVSHIPSEVCLVSGKSAKICSCSCCSEERARKNIVASAASGDESKLESVKEHLVSTSSVASDNQKTEDATPAATSQVKKPGLLRRFQMMYKQYGLVMFCVHWSLATVWTGMFYYAAIRLVKRNMLD